MKNNSDVDILNEQTVDYLLRIKLQMMNYFVFLTTNCVDTFSINEISQNTINGFQLNSYNRNQMFVNGFYIMK